MYTRIFLDRLKKTQGQENSRLKKITQNSSKKLKVTAEFGKRTTNIDPNKGENTVMAEMGLQILNFQLK